jgi:carbamoyltransferase
MEFGPRSLGARSILADPRGPDMRDRINALVKQREAFRPFAPVVLASRAREHFELDHDSPFMLETCQVASSLDLPAITHCDGSARVQTVDTGTNPLLVALLEEFDRLTGCPILLNTSFNVRGEPIVCTPEDAILCFVRARLDALVIEEFILDRDAAPLTWEMTTLGLRRKGAGIGHSVYTLI